MIEVIRLFFMSKVEEEYQCLFFLNLHTKWVSWSLHICNPIKAMPMNNDFTLLPTSELAALVRKALSQEKLRQPKETTVKFLKDFAHNYRVNTHLPENLQGYMLS